MAPVGLTRTRCIDRKLTSTIVRNVSVALLAIRAVARRDAAQTREGRYLTLRRRDRIWCVSVDVAASVRVGVESGDVVGQRRHRNTNIDCGFG